MALNPLTASLKPFDFGQCKEPEAGDGHELYIYQQRHRLFEIMRERLFARRLCKSYEIEPIISEFWRDFDELANPNGNFANLRQDACFHFLFKNVTKLVNPEPGVWTIFTQNDLDQVLKEFLSRLREILTYM